MEILLIWFICFVLLEMSLYSENRGVLKAVADDAWKFDDIIGKFLMLIIGFILAPAMLVSHYQDKKD